MARAKAIIRPLLRLAFFTALVQGGFRWLEESRQFHIDRWVSTMIGGAESMAVEAPSWIVWVLAGVIGLLGMMAWEIAKYRGWFPWQSIAALQSQVSAIQADIEKYVKPRQITDDQAEIIIQFLLGRKPPETVHILHHFPDEEAATYAS